jgi:hypothetical protein
VRDRDGAERPQGNDGDRGQHAPAQINPCRHRGPGQDALHAPANRARLRHGEAGRQALGIDRDVLKNVRVNPAVAEPFDGRVVAHRLGELGEVEAAARIVPAGRSPALRS